MPVECVNNGRIVIQAAVGKWESVGPFVQGAWGKPRFPSGAGSRGTIHRPPVAGSTLPVGVRSEEHTSELQSQ